MYIEKLNVREYLYKGKDVKTGDWKEGSLLTGILGDYAEIKVVESVGDMVLIIPYEIRKDTLCRATDAVSDNGKRIWENDIVLTKSNLIGYVKWVPEENQFVYAFRYDDETEIYKPMDQELVKIIGNIFDNPELIQKKGGNENE